MSSSLGTTPRVKATVSSRVSVSSPPPTLGRWGGRFCTSWVSAADSSPPPSLSRWGGRFCTTVFRVPPSPPPTLGRWGERLRPPKRPPHRLKVGGGERTGTRGETAAF